MTVQPLTLQHLPLRLLKSDPRDLGVGRRLRRNCSRPNVGRTRYIGPCPCQKVSTVSATTRRAGRRP